jgi:hypothetical protein
MATARAAVVLFILSLAIAGCTGRSLVRQFEYEEEVFLELDGSATVIVNASVAALSALRGLPLDTASSARFDRAPLRAHFDSPVTRVTRVSRPWRRAGRRFVQVRVETDDIRALARSGPFSWSVYEFRTEQGLVVFRQRVGNAAGERPPNVNWTGSEVVAFRLHLPSRIQYHNAPSREVERGNILTWEQPLEARMAGTPIEIDVRMDPQSILRRTLMVFAMSVTAALLVMAALVWWVRRKGRRSA